MKKCPSCGASSFFGVSTKNCAWCDKTVCDSCTPTWDSLLRIKTVPEGVAGGIAPYEIVIFCSENCFYQFWQKVTENPAEYPIGTDMDDFSTKIG
ncbi:MAG: hypothetical protein ABSA75_10465 [Candidatus Bathyarchaeia archaeon]